jgi:hypothetical protein
MSFAWRRSLLVVALFASVPAPSNPQSSSSFEGMWSDPPATAEDWFCSGWCTDTGLQRLNTLLDDPANDTRPFDALSVEADAFQRERYIRARLASETLKTYPIDNATDPGFLRCEPWGLARNVVARHQLEIRQRGNDRLEMRYGEWDARRTVYLDNRPRPANQPPTPMGHSTARYERDALVIETAGLRPDRTPFRTEHSSQLRMTERYTRSPDGKRLFLSVTMEDPVTLREPVVLKKVWSWAPTATIAPYTGCVPPTEFSPGK